MKTFNGKSISLKNIQNVLRTMDRTQIFHLYVKIFGTLDRNELYFFIKLNAPSKRVSLAAYDLAFRRAESKYNDEEDKKRWQFIQDNIYQVVVEKFKQYAKNPESPYTKRPMMGYTHLYFASPVYRFEDYNKWCVMPIKGNERFCETICKLADKYFPNN